MRKWKTRTEGSAAQVGSKYEERESVYPYGARAHASGISQTPQIRSVDSMKRPKNFGKDSEKEALKLLIAEWENFVKSGYMGVGYVHGYINNPKIKRITLVGSRAKGTARANSDADFKILIDKVPIRLHVNPRTGEKKELPANRDVATVDFTNYIRDTEVDGVAIDPFIVTDPKQSDYCAHPTQRKV